MSTKTMLRALRRSGGLALLFTLAACESLRPALKSPENDGDPWNLLTTDDFALYTDLPLDEARSRLDQFEMLREALEVVAFPASEEKVRRVAVVLFRYSSDYEALGPRGTVGAFYKDLPFDIERAPTMLLSGGLVASTRQRFIHEMVHELMHRSFGNTPPWLNEGLADYFSTMRVEPERVVLGEALPERAGLRASLVPTVSQITHADQSRFHANGSDTKMATRYYVGSWLLVHLLRDGPEPYRKRFNVLASALHEGARAKEAWRRATEGLDDETLQRDFWTHATSPDWPLFKRKTQEPWRTSSAAVQAMRPAEVHLLWARVARTDDNDRQVATEQIDIAAVLEPDSAEVAYARGCVALRRGLFRDALAAFRRAVTISPHDPRYEYGLALSLLAERGAASGGKDEILRACDDLIATAVSPEEEAFVAACLMDAKRPDDALQRAKHAVLGDERCVKCVATLATILHARGDTAGAIEVIEGALSSSPERPEDRALLDALERYRRISSSKDR